MISISMEDKSLVQRTGDVVYMPSSRRREDTMDDAMRLRCASDLLTASLRSDVDILFNKGALKKTIIAVAGAKGGVGKTMFASNLGVFLSSKGFKTVVVDLDFGGANLHLSLGAHIPSKQNIMTFLSKRAMVLKDVMIKSHYGPWLISGAHSELGTANLEFNNKLRLIKSLRNINADFVILDLGGDMSYNTLDFYLMADYGIVLTTSHPASYMNTYSFIREALYRKIKRAFGPESPLHKERDAVLEDIITETISRYEGNEIGPVSELLDVVKRAVPEKLGLMMRILNDFRPCLVLNKVPLYNNVHYIPVMVQDLSRKWLSKEVQFLGSISDQSEIDRSSFEQVPALAICPQGQLELEFEYIVSKLLNN
jgi:flagellar biosynthesis protein FlhG